MSKNNAMSLKLNIKKTMWMVLNKNTSVKGNGILSSTQIKRVCS